MRAPSHPRRRHEPSPLAGIARGGDAAGRLGGEAPETAGWSSHVHPQRRRRGGTPERSADTRGQGAAGGGLTVANGVVVVDDCGRARRRSAWSCRLPLGTNSLPLAALSLAALASLVDPSTAFQHPMAPPAQAQCSADSRNPLGSGAAFREHASRPLLQGSFTGRLGRQARRVPYVWGLGWPSTDAPPGPQARLEATTPSGGSGGVTWGGKGGMGGEGGVAGVGGVRGRGNGGAGRMTGRSSVESTSMGTREAHAFAQPPTQEGFLNRVATTVDVFPAIVEALSCYKRIHGHLKMLPTFRVAATAPWPENLWGLELGKLVYKLRNEKDVYKRQYPERIQLLKNMGFEWEHSAVADEWDQIITGIETFYHINGHSRVPTRFVIPAEEPWPMEIWGHKLGSRIAQMRMTGRWLGDTEETLEERRNILDKLGFEWRLRVHDDDTEGDGNVEEFSILCEGLEVYQELGGSVPNMPATFVIPNADPWPIRTRGFPLGSQVRVVRSRQKYAKDSQANADRLLALGVPINPIVSTERIGGRWGGPTETRFDKLCKALETFAHLYGHTQVPINFEVPRDEPWPISTWNVKLGMSLSNIVTKGTFIKGYPDRQARLEALGFDTDPGGVRGFKELVRNGMSAADALAESQAALDFADEPTARALPPLGALRGERNDDASQMDSQMLLGSVMDSLRSKETSRNAGVALPPPPSLVEDEGDNEVESSSAWAEEPKKPAWDPDGGEKKEQLPTFMRTEFTDEDRRLTTDDTDMRYWPEETQHQAVRKMIPMLGYLARGYDEVAVVDGAIGTEMVTLPGVLTPSEWDPKRKKEPEYGYVEREDDEYIDEEDEAEVGMIDRQKGRRLTNGCSTSASALDWCTEEVKAHILKVDFEWDEFGDGFRWDDVVAGITLYKTLYGELPHDEFKVPVDYEWPIELSGMQLGSICKQMRIGDIWAKHDTKRKKALDDLGFDWGNDELYLHFQWPEVLISFYSVMRLKGHLDVSPQYVIPEEDPWPMPIRGTPVGFYLNIIKAQKDLLIEHYPDRYEILRGLGVMWSEPILVDWEKEEEKIEYPWREWGFVKVDEEQDEISVDPEFGLKDADPLL